MTKDELKEAFLNDSPVKHNGITYKCVSALIYRKENGRVVASAELRDKEANSCCIVDPQQVEYASE